MKDIHGCGPRKTGLMLIGNQPGREENWEGRPFVGKTGQELGRLLAEDDILPPKPQWFLTNIYRHYGGKDYEYTVEDLERGSKFLLDELKQVQPWLIVTMGREATRWVMGDVDMEDVHGLPWYLPSEVRESKLPFLQPDTVVFPVYHIAGGFHNPEVGGYVLYGFEQLKAFFEGNIKARRIYDDPWAGKETYREIGAASEIVIDADKRLAIDTEGYLRKPWSIQYSQAPGEGYTIRAKDKALCADFYAKLRAARPKLCFHSALHEFGMMRAMSMPIEDMPYDDTMVMSYLLQVEPRGLKPLSTRHCNMKMQSFDDVMGNVQNQLAWGYASVLHDIEQEDYEQRQLVEFDIINNTPLIDEHGRAKRDKLGNIKLKRTKVMPKVPKTPLHRAVERVLRSAEPFRLWHDQIDDVQVEGYRRLGGLPEASLDHVSEEVALRYASRDPDATFRVAEELGPKIATMGLSSVYQLELATYPLIDRMSYVGILPNLQHFADMSIDLQDEINVLREELRRTTGNPEFNANSGDQVAAYLFDQLGLEGFKRTSEGRYSTNDKVLEALEKEHPEITDITLIRDYREVYKLKNTFVDRIPHFVKRYPYDGRVHATFRTTSVVTGRLAASDPNLLAQPKHGRFARRFRRGWVAAEGHWLGEWDLSQIELRVLAHLSQDPVLLEAFRSGTDLHAGLAVRIFGGSLSDHKKGPGRLAAKAINFGIPMGMTYKGLTVELRKNGVMVSEHEAEKWLNDTMTLYARVPEYQDRMKEEAKRNGYIRCLSGRVRYIGGSRSFDAAIRAEAERFAFSTPIQEGAQWLMKQAEAKVWDMILDYKRQGRYIEPLLQVHDALDLEFEADERFAREINDRMVEIMTYAPPEFSVPIGTSGDYGLNLCGWDEKATFDPSIEGCGDMRAF